jgi:hypothetical protein
MLPAARPLPQANPQVSHLCPVLEPHRLAAQQQRDEELLDKIASRLFEVGIALSTAADMPSGSLKGRIDEAVRLLDDLVRGICDAASGGCGHPSDAPARQPGRVTGTSAYMGAKGT